MEDNYYSPDTQKILSEINHLLDFAEDLSSKIDAASEEWARQMSFIAGAIVAILIGGGLAMSIESAFSRGPDKGFFIYVALSSFLVVSVFLSNVAIRSIRKRKSVDVERRILGDLADMISSLFKSIEYKLGSVDRALLNMRMRRISLSQIDGEAFFR